MPIRKQTDRGIRNDLSKAAQQVSSRTRMCPTGLSSHSPGHTTISQMAVSDLVLSRDLASPPTHGLLSNPLPMGTLWPLAGRVVVLRLRGCESEGTGPCGGGLQPCLKLVTIQQGPTRLRFTLCG